MTVYYDQNLALDEELRAEEEADDARFAAMSDDELRAIARGAPPEFAMLSDDELRILVQLCRLQSRGLVAEHEVGGFIRRAVRGERSVA